MQWAEKYKSFKQKNNLKNISFVFLNIFLILLALNLISRNFFITQKEIMLLATVYVLIGFLLLNIPFTKLFKFIINKRSKKNDFVKAIGGLFFIFLSFVFLLFTDSQMIWVASIPLMISGLDLLLKSLKIQKKELYVLSFASFIYAIFYIVVYTVPFVWNALQKFSIIVSNVFGASFGPTVSGFWIFIIFVIFSKTIFFNTKNKKRALLINLHLVLLLVFWITYMAIISIIGFETKSNALNHHFYFFIACLILTFWFVNKIELFQGKIKAKKQKKLLKKVTIWAAVLLLISVILLTTFTGYNVQQNSTKNILFYGSLNNTIGRFDTPDYDKYGDGASGMFGMFPIYLSEAGYNCKILVNDEDYFLNLTFPPLSDKNLTRYSNFTDYVEIIENNRLTSEIFEDIDVFLFFSPNF